MIIVRQGIGRLHLENACQFKEVYDGDLNRVVDSDVRMCRGPAQIVHVRRSWNGRVEDAVPGLLCISHAVVCTILPPRL
jgi:hypothetical protein